MNREDVKALLSGGLAHYRGYRYEQLAALVGSCEVKELTGPDGTVYQLEFEFYWNDGPGRDVRVIGGIDGGDVSALAPLTDSFIMAIDGRSSASSKMGIPLQHLEQKGLRRLRGSVQSNRMARSSHLTQCGADLRVLQNQAT